MNKTNSIKYLDYFFLIRPVLFYPGWSTLLAGYLVANELNNFVVYFFSDGYRLNFFPLIVIYSMLVFATAMGGSFILNQLQDIDSDKRNKKLFLIDEKFVPKNYAIVESFVLFLLSIFCSFFLNYETFILIILFILVTGYLYNYKPFNCKNKPLSGFFVNVLMGWIAFALGWVITKSVNTDFFLNSIPYLFLNAGLYLLTTVPDITGDKSTAKITFSVRYGRTSSIKISLFFFFVSLIASIFLQDYFMIVFFILSLYWIIMLAIKNTEFYVIKTIKMSLFIFSLLIAVFYPAYVLMIISIYFLSKYYYRKRLNFDYPHFRGE